MKCPLCGNLEDKVIDSRLSQDGSATRRRRECLACSKRFTTYERVEETLPLIIKKDGSREPYDRDKILSGIKKACEKRPVSLDDMEKALDWALSVTGVTGAVVIIGETIGAKGQVELVPLNTEDGRENRE